MAPGGTRASRDSRNAIELHCPREDEKAVGGSSIAALRRTVIFGIRTNVAFLARVLDHPRFRAGEVDTGFLEHERESLLRVDAPTVDAAAAAAAWLERQAPAGPSAGVAETVSDPWTTLRGWRA